jgi:hypothetical protein
MAKGITVKHPVSGMTKTGYYGFSWTYLFFGPFVPIFRGELGVGALHLLFSIFTFGVWQIVMAFLYNKQYMTRMLTEKGWVLDGSADENVLARRELGIVGNRDEIQKPITSI